MQTAVLKLHCPDQKGLIARVSNFIHQHDGNIIAAAQHIEELGNRFFMRIHFSMDDLENQRRRLEDDFVALADEMGMRYEFTYSTRRKRMAIMVSKHDHCLHDLFFRHQYGELGADIPLVVSNHPDLGVIARRFDASFHHIPVTADTKETAEQRTLDLFEAHEIDFVVLARYMQILTPLLLGRFPNKVINIHHGFLPAFKGARPYHQAYEKGVKIIGATSHFATSDLDMGPIIAQETVHVDHSHSADDMLRLGRDVEKQVLARAVKAHIDDKIMVYNNRTIVFR